ncbi:MAG: hypothetical protein AVDCRST_MAG10-1368, partial [uncultured Acidimicrobiales bacterium]
AQAHRNVHGECDSGLRRRGVRRQQRQRQDRRGRHQPRAGRRQGRGRALPL